MKDNTERAQNHCPASHLQPVATGNCQLCGCLAILYCCHDNGAKLYCHRCAAGFRALAASLTPLTDYLEKLHTSREAAQNLALICADEYTHGKAHLRRFLEVNGCYEATEINLIVGLTCAAFGVALLGEELPKGGHA